MLAQTPRILVTALLLMGCAPVGSSRALAFGAEKASNPWSVRSGRSEALADLAAGRPVKLYLQSVAGERAVDRTPGLSNCNPGRSDVPKAQLGRFAPLGENYSESVVYTAEQVARINAATVFARDYNQTMFHKKKREVLGICPSASINGANQ